ncbi:MAG: hypothetical protein ACYS8K_07810, partial [Planctomycetota bacterium]
GVCYHGQQVTAFAGRQQDGLRVYANTEFRSDGPREVFSRDVTHLVGVGHAGTHPVALTDDRRTLVAVGSCHEEGLTTPVTLGALLEEGRTYRLRQYSSERGEWDPPQTGRGADFASLGVRIEAKGYHLLEFACHG